MRPPARLSHLLAEMRIKEIHPILEALLATSPRGFRNKHLAQALGVSPSRASQLLAPRIVSRELARAGEGRGLYIRGPDWGKASGAVARGAARGSFWKAWSKIVHVSPMWRSAASLTPSCEHAGRSAPCCATCHAIGRS